MIIFIIVHVNDRASLKMADCLNSNMEELLERFADLRVHATYADCSLYEIEGVMWREIRCTQGVDAIVETVAREVQLLMLTRGMQHMPSLLRKELGYLSSLFRAQSAYALDEQQEIATDYVRAVVELCAEVLA